MSRYFSNVKFLKGFRKTLRNNSTSAEAVLWNHLKNKKLDGRKFRRQHSLGKYIVDFYCHSEKLVIELDGDSHGDYYRISEDEERDEFLIKNGFKIRRFENKVVFQDCEYLLNEIRKCFND